MLYYIFFQLIILTILFITNLIFLNLEWFLAFFGVILENYEDWYIYFIYWVISVIEASVIIILVTILYHKPITKLEFAIKSFLVWNLKDNDIKFPKTLNSSLNYALLFFTKTLNTLKNIKDEFVHWKEIKWEVELAKEIQWKILTKKQIEIPSLSMIFKSKPAWEIGWDSFDIIQQKNNYYIYVWDATGHWVWAGFIMVMVNALISWFSKAFRSWAEILAKTNEVLKPRIKTNLLMSLLMVRWNEEEKRLFMTWAGHEYLMIYKAKQNKTYKVKSGWVALWMIKDISKLLKEVEIEVEAWDIIVLYSDWITEAINKSKRDWEEELFGEQRLVDAIQNAPIVEKLWYKTATSVFKNISINLSNFMWYKFTQLDDITLWVIQYKPKNFNEEKDINKKIEKEFIAEWQW